MRIKIKFERQLSVWVPNAELDRVPEIKFMDAWTDTTFPSRARIIPFV
jgi:hypothetical protein